MKFINSLRSMLCLCLIVLFLTATGRSQTTTAGSFRGTVTDQSGAVLPAVKLEIRHTATGLTREAITDEKGFYLIPSVSPGIYDFTITYQGFQTLTSQGARLQVNQNATIDFTLKPGAVAEQITVTAETPLLNATDATIGTVVEREKIVQLPLNGRQYTRLILLTPGAAPQNSGQQKNFEVAADLGAVSPSVNGQSNTHNNFTIDGVENNELFFNFPAISPPPDAIEEFKVQSNMSSGAFGRAPGANVNVETRRGTNEIHGTLWEFLRNDALDASNFFANAAGSKKPPFRFNQFGAVAGGPLLKDKAWAFGYYEGLRKSIGSTLFGTVPTPAQIGGDLSGFPQIFDPETTRLVGVDARGNAIFTRDPFPNNIIPSNRLDPIIQQIARKFYPAPNLSARLGQPNFLNTEARSTDIDSFGVRADAVLPKDTRFFTRFSFVDAKRSEPNPIPDTPIEVLSNHRQAVIGLNRTFGPTTVVDVRLQYLRTTSGRFRRSDPSFLKSSGVLAVFPAPDGQPQFLPQFAIDRFTAIPPGKYVPIGPFNNWEFTGSATKVAGNHTISVGGNFMYTDALDDDNYADAAFRGEETADPQKLASTGSGLASYLLGIPANARRESGVTQLVLHGKYFGVFIDEQWKVTPKLNLTFALRYDYSEPKKDRYNRQCALDLFASKPGALRPGADPGQTGSYAIDGFSTWLCAQGYEEKVKVPIESQITTIPKGAVKPDKNNFSPRASLAYRLTSKTVVRTGFGLFYEFNQSDFQNPQSIMGQWPFGQPSGLSTGSNQPTVNNPTPQFTLLKGIFPPFQPITHIPSDPGFAMFPQNRTPYVAEWNLGVEHSLDNDWLVSGTYVGTKGTHIPAIFRANEATTPGPGPIAPRRPLPQHAGGLRLLANWTNTSYHAGQLKVEKRFSRGLSFLLSYTYGKSIDIVSGSNSVGAEGQGTPIHLYNVNRNRGVSSHDLTHNFVFSSVYDLPFGEGKALGNGTNWVSRRLASGWQITGILSLHNGFPFGIVTGDVANIGGSTQRPQLVGELLPSTFKQTREKWFDTAALVEVPFTLGNLGKNVLREDGFQNFDFGVIKRTNFNERMALEFRAEFFNFFNHTNFDAPTTNFRSGSFGGVFATKLPADLGGNRVIQFGLKFIF